VIGMRVIKGLEGIRRDRFRSPVATLGTFDGVHLGHQAVVRAVRAWADERDADAVVLTFQRHPRRVLHGKAPSLIVPVSRRLALLEALGADTVVLLPFTPEFASIPAETFVADVLAGALGAGGVVLGFDASFGKDKEGNIDLLAELGPAHGFEARFVPAVHLDGRPVSSSLVRSLIREGDVQKAAGALGRPVALEGSIVPGRGRGRSLGFPTANLDLDHEVRPPPGVYAGRVRIEAREHACVVNIGTSPTLAEGLAESVEVHVLDFSGDLYGASLYVEITKRLRPERKFPSLEGLVAAIEEDVRTARAGARTT